LRGLFEPEAFGPEIAILLAAETVRKVVGLVKLEISLFAGLLMAGATLLARAQIQGLEGALISTAIEYGLRGVRAGATVVKTWSHWIG
jgi:hypothetical protein